MERKPGREEVRWGDGSGYKEDFYIIVPAAKFVESDWSVDLRL